MTVGLNFISAAVRGGAGNAVLAMDADLMIEPREVAVFDFVKSYYRSHREMPPPDVVQQQTGTRLPNGSGALSFYAEELRDRFDFHIVRESWDGLRERIQEGRAQPIVDIMENTIRRIRRSRPAGNLIDIHQGMSQVTDRLRRAQIMGGMSGVPTPWPTFNAQSGGYQPADLITFVARSGMGKTAMILQQAETAFEAGYSVLFVTTEMSSEQITRRWMANRFNLDPYHLKMGTISTHLLRRMELMQAELLGRERFRLLSLGTGAKLSAIEVAIEETCPDIVFIDGIYLFRPMQGGSNLKQSERVTAVFDELKQQTIDSNLPHIVTTQFNRAAGKGGKEGSLETIGLSDAIGWHSSIVVAVKAGPTENPLRSRELDFLKGREGEEGKFAINFKFKPVDFSEMTREEVAALEATGPLNTINGDWE